MSPTTLYDVAVVGSGPAGSSAARRLAKHGARVLLLEKASLPRYKTCGGGVVGRARRLLPAGVREAVERECSTAELHLLDADLHFSTHRSRPLISMTMRETLDFTLTGMAEAAGAEVRSECEVVGLTLHSDRVELRTAREPVWARFVIAADGAISPLATRAGWPETRPLIPALEYEVSVPDAVLERFSGAARFDFGLVPAGYAWVFPKAAHLSMGVLSTRRGATKLNDFFGRYLQVLDISAHVREIRRHGFLIPVRPRRDTFVRRRVLLAGDAAGLVDPLTGEGISFAITSGRIAAEVVLAERFDETRIRRAYRRELERSVLPELRIGRMLARLIYDHPRVRTSLFRSYGQRLSEAVTDVLMGERSYRAILSAPESYLKLVTLRPIPGRRSARARREE